MEACKSYSFLISVVVVSLVILLPLLLNPSNKKEITLDNTSQKTQFFSSVNHKHSNKLENSQKRGRGVGSKDITTRAKHCGASMEQQVEAKPESSKPNEVPRPFQPRGKDGQWHHRGSSQAFFQKSKPKTPYNLGQTHRSFFTEIAVNILELITRSI